MRKLGAVLWLVLLVLACVHVAVTARHGLPLDSDLMGLLPREDRDPDVQLAKDRMAETLGHRLVVMVGHADRSMARAQAAALRDALVAKGLVRPESDIPSPDSIRRLGSAYFPHRAGLLAEADRQKLQAGESQALVNRALSQVYGVAGPVDSRLLRNDPLLLFPAFLAALPAPSNRLSVDDGMLSVQDDNVTWIMLPMVLTSSPYDLDLQQRVSAIYDQTVVAAPAGTRWLRLGALFYAQDGVHQGTRESSRIGTLSLLGTILLLVAVFRSSRPLVLALVAVAAGFALALSACLLLFGSLHVAAQLFGTTLIGVAVDYALLYFGQVFMPQVRPTERLSRVWTGMVLGAATTIIGYAMLALSPFPGLRQVAVFSTVGLLGSLLTVMLWFPLLDRTPARPLPPFLGRATAAIFRFWDAPERRAARLATLAMLAVMTMIGGLRINADDDMRHQQGLSPILTAEQAEIQALAGFSLTSQFFLVSGDTEQTVLEREEELGQRLDGLTGWQSVARYVPSARRQTETAQLTDQTLVRPHLAAYQARLGMMPTSAPAIPDQPLYPADILATGALPFLDALVIDPHRHVVALDRVKDMAAVAKAAEGLEGVRFIDPTGDLNGLLRAYRLRALALLAISVIAMMPLLAVRYGWKGALRVAAPPVSVVAITPFLLAMAGLDFSFFAAMALVLVLSIGTDYAIFCAEGGDRDRVTLLSVSLAMLTTLLSFGLLAASDLAGVRAFGATMLVGVALAFAASPLVGRHR